MLYWEGKATEDNDQEERSAGAGDGDENRKKGIVYGCAANTRIFLNKKIKQNIFFLFGSIV